MAATTNTSAATMARAGIGCGFCGGVAVMSTNRAHVPLLGHVAGYRIRFRRHCDQRVLPGRLYRQPVIVACATDSSWPGSYPTARWRGQGRATTAESRSAGDPVRAN